MKKWEKFTDEQLKQFVKDSKEYNLVQNQAYFEPDDPYYYNNNPIISGNTNEMNEKIEGENKPNDNSKTKNGIENNKGSEEVQEKKEEIPLLIIDVNIRQGVKKKIYVFEGDTPEALADKFAKEHNLEPETKNKLQTLIHRHMLRLLTRIEEENQTISDKGQNLHKNLKK